jgi:hypothetical protein
MHLTIDQENLQIVTLNELRNVKVTFFLTIQSRAGLNNITNRLGAITPLN